MFNALNFDGGGDKRAWRVKMENEKEAREEVIHNQLKLKLKGKCYFYIFVLNGIIVLKKYSGHWWMN